MDRGHDARQTPARLLAPCGAEGSVTIPGDATILDFSQAWVLPGLIDCHTHITSQPEDIYNDDYTPRNFQTGSESLMAWSASPNCAILPGTVNRA